MNLRHLTDKALLADTRLLVAHEREISLKVLHHLKEIERRRLFADLGYPSLFEYTVRELGYSEPSAARRISAARLLKDMPEIAKRIENGTFSLTNLSLVSKLFKNEDITDVVAKKEILKQIEGTTKKECEKVLMTMIPPADIPKENIKRVNAQMHAVKINFSEETLWMFTELKSRHAHRRISQDQLLHEIFKASLDEYKRKHEPNAKFTTLVAEPCNDRYIAMDLKKYIFKRDEGKCTNCGSIHKLEYDHIKPFSLGGKTSKENLRLLCFSCNQRSRIKAKL